MPALLSIGVGVLPFQGIGQVDGAVAAFQILLMDHANAFQVCAEGVHQAVGEDGDAVLAPFAVADDDLVLGEFDVFDPQAQTF